MGPNLRLIGDGASRFVPYVLRGYIIGKVAAVEIP